MEKYLTRAEKVKAFREGIVAGIPIGLGYFAVSFSLGIAARGAGLSPVQGFIASILCLASAGEYVGFTLIAASASYIEVAIATFIANAKTWFGITLPTGWDGHDWDKWVKADDATCIANATHKRWCKLCNKQVVEDIADTQLVVEYIVDQGNCADIFFDNQIRLVCKWCKVDHSQCIKRTQKALSF